MNPINVKNESKWSTSIRNKIVLIITIVAIFTSGIGIIFSLFNHLNQIKKNSLETANVIASLIADYCSVDLYFNDAENAKETLRRLTLVPNVTNAVIFDLQGKPFAQYPENIKLSFSKLQSFSTSNKIKNDYIHIFKKVFYHNQYLGTVYIRFSLANYKSKLKDYMWFSVLLFAMLIAFSFFIAFRLEGLISKPILTLATIAKNISKNNRFDVTIPEPKSKDEIGMLYTAFGQMIKTIKNFTSDLSRKNEELEQSKSYFQTLFHSSPDSIVLFNPEGKIIDVNNQFFKSLGYKKEIAKNLYMKDIIESFEDINLDLSGKTKYQEFEAIATNMNGEKIPVLVRLNTVQLRNEKLFLAFIADYTQRKKAEEEILHLKNYLYNIIESMPSILIVLDEKSQVTLWNSTASKYFHVDYSEIIGKVLWNEFSILEKYKPYVEVVLISQKPQEINNDPQIIDGKQRFFDIYFFPVEMGGEFHVVMRMDDVTEMLLQEEQLRQAQKMETIGTLAGGFAHDFNNVLGAIMGSLSLLEFKLQNNVNIPVEKLLKAIEDIENSTQRASEMVKQLLSLSRKQDLHLKATDLSKVLKEVKQICEISMDKNININFKIPENPQIVDADSTHLQQVILNLCVNAAHAMTIMRENEEAWGGTLTVNTNNFFADQEFVNHHPEARIGEYWVIEVSDTGVGIDESILPKIFDPFFTTKSKGVGSGLGLAMVYYIVKQHSGFIDVYSVPGSGSTFKIYLPVSKEEKEVEIKEEEDISKYFGKGRILVIDDEDIIRNTAHAILSVAGYDVDVASSGKEALDMYSKEKYDLVILDLIMPGMTGREVFQELKKINPDIKVLLTTGFTRDKRVEELIKSGIFDYMQKPFTMSIIIKKVYNALHDSN